MKNFCVLFLCRTWLEYTCSTNLFFCAFRTIGGYCHYAKSLYKWLYHNLHILNTFEYRTDNVEYSKKHTRTYHEQMWKTTALCVNQCDEKLVSTSNVIEFFLLISRYLSQPWIQLYDVKAAQSLRWIIISVNNNLLFKCNLFRAFFHFAYTIQFHRSIQNVRKIQLLSIHNKSFKIRWKRYASKQWNWFGIFETQSNHL